jgi:hypothetical protein
MPAEGLLPRLRELGRLRAGDVEEITTKAGKTKIVPTKLDHWKLTSSFRNLIEAAAKLYGGEVTEWAGAPTEHKQWQVLTDCEELEVLVPPQDVDVMYERWSGGGRQALCDGIIEKLTDEPCSCDPSNRACKPRTQLVVLLPQIPDLGHWRLVTQSVFAAMELPATMVLLRRIHDAGGFAHATLALEQRTTKTEGTKHFAVPVLRLAYTLAEAGLVPTKAANLDTGEIVSPALAAGEQPVVDAVSGEGASATGGTSGDKEQGDGAAAGPPAEYPPEDVPAPEVSEGVNEPARTGAETSERGAPCLHLKGSRSVPVNRPGGGTVEVCVECLKPIETRVTA